jgi:hypothetical protein
MSAYSLGARWAGNSTRWCSPAEQRPTLAGCCFACAHGPSASKRPTARTCIPLERGVGLLSALRHTPSAPVAGPAKPAILSRSAAEMARVSARLWRAVQNSHSAVRACADCSNRYPPADTARWAGREQRTRGSLVGKRYPPVSLRRQSLRPQRDVHQLPRAAAARCNANFTATSTRPQ